MKIKNAIFICSVVLLLSACVNTYKENISSYPFSVTYPVDKNKAELLKNTSQVLIMEGFVINAIDKDKGTISTMPKEVSLSSDEASCDNNMVLDYLKDSNIKTIVSYNILVGDYSLTVKPDIIREYKTEEALQSITISCDSNGILEEKLIDKITFK